MDHSFGEDAIYNSFISLEAQIANGHNARLSFVSELEFNLLDCFFKPELKAFGGGLRSEFTRTSRLQNFQRLLGRKRYKTIKSFLPNFLCVIG
jgi:hypothetical protein